MHILCDSDGERVQCLTWVENRQQIRQDHLETSALCESRQWGEPVCAACLSIHTHDYLSALSGTEILQLYNCVNCKAFTIQQWKLKRHTWKQWDLNIWQYRDASGMQFCDSREVNFIIQYVSLITPHTWDGATLHHDRCLFQPHILYIQIRSRDFF